MAETTIWKCEKCAKTFAERDVIGMETKRWTEDGHPHSYHLEFKMPPPKGALLGKRYLCGPIKPMNPPDWIEPSPYCCDCKRKPNQIVEYTSQIHPLSQYKSADDYVRREEGTYNRAVDRFCCTDCYIIRGCPSLPAPNRWVAP